MNAATQDYSKPPRTEFEGRKFTAQIEFCIVEDATDDQIWEWLEYEIGGGSIASAHPLVESGAQLSRVSVTDLRNTGYRIYTDWGPTSADGKCSGKGRVERDAR